MKKLLAIILATLMLASVAVASTLAADEETIVDMGQFYRENDVDAIAYVGGKIAAAPMLDGSIGEGEYSATKVREKGGNYSNHTESDYTEYFAHDDDYVYYAATYKQAADNRAFDLQFKVMNNFEYPAHMRGYYDRAHIMFRMVKNSSAPDGWEFNFTTNVNSGYSDRISGVTVDPLVWEENVWVAADWDLDDTNFKTVELKIAKSYFAEALGVENDEFKTIQYFANLHDTQAWAIMNRDLELALADMGAISLLEGTAYLAMVFDEEPAAPATTTTVAPAATTTAAPAATTTAAATTAAATTTKAATTAAAADATTEAAAEEGGCGSTLAISALVMIPTLAGGVILTSKRRKED